MEAPKPGDYIILKHIPTSEEMDKDYYCFQPIESLDLKLFRSGKLNLIKKLNLGVTDLINIFCGYSTRDKQYYTKEGLTNMMQVFKMELWSFPGFEDHISQDLKINVEDYKPLNFFYRDKRVNGHKIRQVNEIV